MSVEIRVLGEFEFIKQIIEGVARVFSNPNVFNAASAVLLMLLLLWTSMAHIMNPDKAPFPFREFLMGLIGWIVFASPMSPKYDVELTSIRNVHEFTVINDVPFLAAIPSALASNFFSGLRESMEVSFVPVTYSNSDKQADPLSTLVKMYDQRPPTSMQFNTGDQGYDLGKSVSNYVKNCYLADHELRGRDPTKPINYLRTSTIGENLFSELRVAYDFLQTDIYLTPGGSHFGEYVDCPTAFTRIKGELTSTALENKIVDFYDKKGISQDALRDSSAMIYGAYGIGPSPYDIQVGMLQSYMIRDGLQNTSLETFSDQMVLQGMRKRVYEKAGERALFNQIAIPVITALECFAFYMAPIMMLLAVLGGAGFAMVKKYLMLILFVNLWGFIAIFVDLYTAISVENALGVSAGFDPFSFDSLPDTILEVEGFLATAAALTASIPMLAMFLLYGGVHSMMGVMRNVASGSVDGNMAAPTVSSNMNGGVQKIGDTSRTFGLSTGAYAEGHTISNNQQYGTASVGGTETSGWGASAQTVQGQVASSQSTFQQSFSQAVASGISTTSSNDTQNAANWSSMNTDTKLSTLANTENKGESFSNAEKAQMAISAAGAAGISLPGNVLGGKGGITLSTGQEESKTYQEMLSRAKSFQNISNTADSSGQSSGIKEASGTGKMWSDNESSQEAKSALESYQESLAKSKALNDTISSGSVVANTMQLNNAQAAAVLDGQHINEFSESLTPKERAQLGELKQEGDNTFSVMQNWVSQLGAKDSSLKEDAEDKALSSKIMGFIGETLGGKEGAGAGFLAAAATYQAMSQAVLNVDNKDYGMDEATADQTANVAGAAASTARTAEINDNTDTIAPTNQTEVKGYSGPTKEELQRQDELANNSIETGKLDYGRAAMNLFDTNQRWDSGDIGNSVNSHAVGNGVYLPSIASGADSLLTSDYRTMPKDEQMDAIVAGNYMNNNSDLMALLSPEEQERFTSNYNKVMAEADGKTLDMAKKVESGEISRNQAGMALFGARTAPDNNPEASGLQLDSASTSANNIRGDYFSSRAFEQASAIEQANAFDHNNTNINEEVSGTPSNLAALASTLANMNTSRESLEEIAQGENSDSWANKIFGINSHDSLNSAVAGMSVLEGLRGIDDTYDNNLDTLQAEMRNNGAYIPKAAFVGDTQSDGTLGGSFTHGDNTYSMLGSHNGINMYEDQNGDLFRQASGSPGISEVYGGSVPSNMINHDEGLAALNLINGSALVDGMEYTAAGEHTIGEGDDVTVLGNKYKASDGEHYYLHKNQMKMILN
jgi:hypothetical protein